MKRLAAEPFALVGVNSDRERAEAAEAMRANGLVWPSFHDGQGGPIARAWRIRGWPTIVLIDADGIIRFRSVGADESVIEHALAALIAAAKAGPRSARR